jgi:hypothetical protein
LKGNTEMQNKEIPQSAEFFSNIDLKVEEELKRKKLEASQKNFEAPDSEFLGNKYFTFAATCVPWKIYKSPFFLRCGGGNSV